MPGATGSAEGRRQFDPETGIILSVDHRHLRRRSLPGDQGNRPPLHARRS
jgi:hypothetical protein